MPVLLIAAPAQVLPEPSETVAPCGTTSLPSTLKVPCVPGATVTVSVLAAKVTVSVDVFCVVGELINTVEVPQSALGKGKFTPPLQAL